MKSNKVARVSNLWKTEAWQTKKLGGHTNSEKAQKLIEKIKKTGVKNPRERMNQPDAPIVPEATKNR